MLLSVVPLSVLAADNRPKQKVAVVVYSAQFTELLRMISDSLSDSLDSISDLAKKAIATGVDTPQVKATLTENVEGAKPYEMTEQENYNILNSFQLECQLVESTRQLVEEKIFGNFDFINDLKNGIVDTTQEFVDQTMEAILGGLLGPGAYGTIYRVYMTDVPATEDGVSYTLKVEEFNKTKDPAVIQAGYILCNQDCIFKTNREYDETITLKGDGSTPQFLGSKDVRISGDLNPLTYLQTWASEWVGKLPFETTKTIAQNLIDVFLGSFNDMLGDTSFAYIFPGLWCDESEAGFTFQNTDIKDVALTNSDFLMFNRDEVVNILKFLKDIGKDAFNGAIKATFGGTVIYSNGEKYTYDSIVELYTNIISSDEDGQMQLNPDNLFGIVQAYMTVLMDLDLFNRVKAADLVIPAILKASADENGLVTFNRNSNITLVWGIQILQEIMKQGGAQLEEAGILPEWATTMLDLTTKIADGSGDIAADLINEYPYAVAQGLGIVGPKMQDDHYVMMQIKAPVDREGREDSSEYWINPFAYTMDVRWENADWIYVTLADLGIVVPYFAEGFYDFVRGTTFEGTVDKFLGKVTGKDDFDLITRIFNAPDENDVTAQVLASLTAFTSSVAMKAFALDTVFANTSELVSGLNDYLYKHGRTAQNLMIYLNNQAKKAKEVYAGDLGPTAKTVDIYGTTEYENYWQFYNIDKSPTVVATKLIQKSTEGISAAIVDEKESAAVSKAGNSIATTVSTVGAKIEAQTVAVKEKVAVAVTTTLKTVATKAVSTLKSVVTNLFSNIGNLFKKGYIAEQFLA